jgi:hypothetical protein
MIQVGATRIDRYIDGKYFIVNGFNIFDVLSQNSNQLTS